MTTTRTAVLYLTVPETADYLNTSVRFVRRLIAERRIAFHKVGTHVRIAVADVEAFLMAGRVEPITPSSVLRDLRGWRRCRTSRVTVGSATCGGVSPAAGRRAIRGLTAVSVRRR